MSCVSRLAICLALISSLLLWASHDARASPDTPLYSFCQSAGNPTCVDGNSPWSRLLQVGADFYGTTASGGAGGPVYSGTLFRVTATGVFKSLHSFCVKPHCSDGGMPGKYLARGPDGDIFGVAENDGGNANAGTVFKISSDGQFTTLYRLCSQKECLDGFQPIAVVFDKAGNLFGTTSGGGKYHGGTVFELTAKGTFRKLHDFCAAASCTDGILPGALILGSDGNFYGTAKAGGANQGGSIFKITPAGNFTTLYSFCALKKCADGEQPNQILAEGNDGNFYGTAVLGGANAQGSVFRLTAAGNFKILHSFCEQADCNDGNAPLDGLAIGAGGDLYGTAGEGGIYYHGVLFSLTRAGDYRVIHSFCAERGCFDGAAPAAAPVQGRDGNLYGTAQAGGNRGDVGTIYKLTP